MNKTRIITVDTDHRMKPLTFLWNSIKEKENLAEMSWGNNDKTSSDRSKNKDNSSFDEERNEKSIVNKQDRASKETSTVSKHLNENTEDFHKRYDTQWLTKRRLPRYYSINNNQTKLIILQGDITKTKVDAIVNAANEHMTGGSGVDGIVHRYAGDKLYDACKAHKQITPGVRLPTGHSRILLSYNMSRTTYYIINTAGPVYSSRAASECAKDLSSCYKTALALANLYDLESIGFTAISCGIFGYPANDGAEVALKTVDKEAGSLLEVVFVLWDDHIYDAWVKKAEELGFVSINVGCTVVANPSKQLSDDVKPKTTENPSTNYDEQASPTTYNPPIIDASSPDTADKTPDPELENLLKKLPSVPDESTDTQQTVDMEENDNTTKDNSQLATQETVVMTNVSSEEDKTPINDHSEQQPTQEEMGQSDAKKPTTEPTSNNNIDE